MIQFILAILRSPQAAKTLGVGLVIALIGAAYLYVAGLRAAVSALESDLEATQSALQQSEVQRVLDAQNRVEIDRDTRREQERSAEVSSKVQVIVKEVYRDRPQVAQECRAVLSPIATALDGVREIRNGRSTE